MILAGINVLLSLAVVVGSGIAIYKIFSRKKST